MRGLAVLTVALVALALASCDTPDLSTVGADDGACRVVRVIDGDTVDMRCTATGVFRARLTGFDTPEIFSPACIEEKRLGTEARTRLARLVRNATTTEARIGGVDRYDRRLVRLSLDGTDVAQTLISGGLAVRYSGGRRINWCARLT